MARLVITIQESSFRFSGGSCDFIWDSVDLFYDARYAHSRMTNPDFIALARAMRVHAIRCESAEELPEKMKEFLEYDDSKPVLMECVVENNEHVFPMVSYLPSVH